MVTWYRSLDLQVPPTRRSAPPGALEHLPIVAAAFERELSYSKVRAITRVAYPAIEQGLRTMAKSIHTAGLERIVAGSAAPGC
ncbi:MAG: hypothetical protein R2749_16560 [Acidimicrobiales bacterium]